MGPLNTYAIGQTIVLEGKTTDEDGYPVAPVDPQILLRPPSGSETSLEVESVVVGTWYHELYLEGPAGLYSYRLLTSDDALELTFHVAPSEFDDPLG